MSAIPRGASGVFSVSPYRYPTFDDEFVLFSIVFPEGTDEDFQGALVEEACDNPDLPESKFKAIARNGDISGRSKEVILAAKRAKKMGKFLINKGFHHILAEQE